MSAQMNMTLAKAVWDALSVGDVEVLDELLGEDLKWHVSGNNRLSGTKTGRDQVLDYLGTLGEETEVYDLQLQDILVNEDRALILLHVNGKREGRTLDTQYMLLFQVEDNRLAEAWTNPFNQHAVDRFWA